MINAICVESLSKSFKMRKSLPGILGMLKSLFIRDISVLEAVHNLNFFIRKGEKVAFIGPNGAGKSTTIKMLSGILHPTSGSINVLGLIPWKDRYHLGFKIGTVFGHRTQLWYHLPAVDSFDLLAKIYELDESFYRKQLKELSEVFEIGAFLHQPVRKLSLGQRMRCEIVASLLHQPEILFLDEPTIGLDVSAKLKIREYLSLLSKKYGMTLFLTSHDTADIEQICDRVIVLDKGRILKDCSVKELKKSYVKKKIVTITTEDKTFGLSLPGVKIVKQSDYSFVSEIDLETMPIDQLIRETIKVTSLKDVTIEDPSMDEIIQDLYGKIR